VIAEGVEKTINKAAINPGDYLKGIIKR